MAGSKRVPKSTPPAPPVEHYDHPNAQGARVPDAGAQPFVKTYYPAGKYTYDSSLAPSMEWDEHPARERAEALIAQILEADSLEDAKAAAERLKAMSRPFLNWTGKREQQAFDVLTLPLFVHERLSTKGIILSVCPSIP